MTPERERILDLILSLPEEDQAHYFLGRYLMQSFRKADLDHTAADLAYVRDTLRRIHDAVAPECQEQLRGWLGRDGTLRLWDIVDGTVC